MLNSSALLPQTARAKHVGPCTDCDHKNRTWSGLVKQRRDAKDEATRAVLKALITSLHSPTVTITAVGAVEHTRLQAEVPEHP